MFAEEGLILISELPLRAQPEEAMTTGERNWRSTAQRSLPLFCVMETLSQWFGRVIL
jgi:hypothetical protein